LDVGDEDQIGRTDSHNIEKECSIVILKEYISIKISMPY